MKRDIEIKVNSVGKLLAYLQGELSNIPRGKVKSYLEHRQISVNGIVTTKYDHPLKVGDTVKISMSEGSVKTHGVEVIYEDEYLLAVNKPAKLLSVPTEKEKERSVYTRLLENRRGELYVIHRLDRDTSGVLLFAKKREICTKLQDNWNEAVKLREYMAICEGHFEKKKGRCDSLITENSVHRMYSGYEGKRAITDYEVIREEGDYSLVRLRLLTGRKNQIRVHMKEIGNPVVGDKKYGSETNPIGRLGLHASALSFIHPVTGKEIKIHARHERKFALPK